MSSMKDKASFIRALTAAFESRGGQAMLSEALGDFEEFFADARRDGRSEEEICAQLGDPEDIAGQFCAAENVSDAGETAPVGEGVYIRLTDADLFISPCDGAPRATVSVGRRHPVDPAEAGISINVREGVLAVVQERPSRFREYLFSVRSHKCLYVGLPAAYGGTFSAEVGSGNARAEGISMLNDLTLHVGSGNVQLTGVSTAGVITADAGSGNVSLERCRGAATVGSGSGNVSVRAHRGTVSARSRSGNVTVETDVIDCPSAVETRSGNVKVALGRLCADLNASCSSGSISLDVGELAGNLTGKTSSGNVTAWLSAGTKAYFNLSSHGARSDFPNTPPPSADLPVVTLSSRSGFVRVKER